MAPALERRRRNVRRDRSVQMAVLAFALFVGLVAGIAGSPRGATASDNADEQTTARAPRRAVLPARTMLFGHIGLDHRLDLLVAFGWNRGAREGTSLLIPPTLMVEVPSLGPQALADVPNLASQRLLEVVVENALGVDFDAMVLVADTKLAAVLAPAGTMTIDLSAPTRIDDSAGTLSYRAGRRDIEPSEAMRLLTAKGADQLSHLVTVGAVLNAWRAALADRAAADATVHADQRLLPLAIARNAKVRNSTLPVERLSSGGEERFRLRPGDAYATVERLLPWALISDAPRPRVEVLNGAGGVGVTQDVAAMVVPAGGEVTLTGNVPGFGVEATRVVYYRKQGAAAAKRLAKALGVGSVVRAASAIDVVDVTIIVGKDFQPHPE
jgi:hypothetical protein